MSTATRSSSKKEHVCTECGKGFAEKYTLNNHLRLHTGETPYSCKSCNEKFKQQSALRYHEKKGCAKNSNEKGTFECDFCSRIFKFKTKFDAHSCKRIRERRMICPHCPKAFPKKYDLDNHVRVHTGEKPFTCEHCSKKFTTESTLKAHLMIHTGEKPHVCSNCQWKFRHLSSLKKHIASGICFGSSEDNVDQYPCSQCLGTFRTARHLRNHVQNIHKETEENQSTNITTQLSTLAEPQGSSEMLVPEAMDDESSNDQVDIKTEPEHVHVKVEPMEAIKDEPTEQIAIKDEIIECEICWEKFSSLSELNEHVMQSHDEITEVKLVCEVCSVETTNREAFDEHMKMHADVLNNKRAIKHV